jgi:2-polyprenyl-3-methyl-5-hydroxy-6-metoxy-1,4-benzoquinol methylase
VSDVEGVLVIDEAYLEGLSDIRPGQRLSVIFHFHKSPEFTPRHSESVYGIGGSPSLCPDRDPHILHTWVSSPGVSSMAEMVCPWWVGYILANPLRRLMQDPDKILASYVKPGMTVLDVGCAMGFFSIPMARMVGPDGRIVCVDMQRRMLGSLARRARRAGVPERIDARSCSQQSLGLDDLADQLDFALAFAVVHEVSDAPRLLAEVAAALRSSGRLLIAEPKGHVKPRAFDETVRAAQEAGLTLLDRPEVPYCCRNLDSPPALHGAGSAAAPRADQGAEVHQQGSGG